MIYVCLDKVFKNTYGNVPHCRNLYRRRNFSSPDRSGRDGFFPGALCTFGLLAFYGGHGAFIRASLPLGRRRTGPCRFHFETFARSYGGVVCRSYLPFYGVCFSRGLQFARSDVCAKLFSERLCRSPLALAGGPPFFSPFLFGFFFFFPTPDR